MKDVGVRNSCPKRSAKKKWTTESIRLPVTFGTLVCFMKRGANYECSGDQYSFLKVPVKLVSHGIIIGSIHE